MGALIKSEQLYYMLALMPGMVYWKNHKGEYEGCNYHYAKVLGFNRPEEIRGKTDFDLFSTAVAESLTKIDNEVIQTGQERSYENGSPNPEQTNAIYFVEKFPLLNADKEICGLLSVSTDITERKLLANELTSIKTQLAHLETECHDLGTELEGVQSRLATADLDMSFISKTDIANKISELSKSNSTPINVLLVEDDSIAMAVAKQALEELNCRVTTAINVFDANDKINTIKFDLIVSDINLSAGSGIDIARHVTQNAKGINQQTPLVAITMHGDKQMRTKLQNVGFSALLQKPLDKRELAAVVEAQVPRAQTYSAVSSEKVDQKSILDL